MLFFSKLSISFSFFITVPRVPLQNHPFADSWSIDLNGVNSLPCCSKEGVAHMWPIETQCSPDNSDWFRIGHVTQSEPMRICGTFVAIAGREVALLPAALDLERAGFRDTVSICHQVVELENEARRVKE